MLKKWDSYQSFSPQCLMDLYIALWQLYNLQLKIIRVKLGRGCSSTVRYCLRGLLTTNQLKYFLCMQFCCWCRCIWLPVMLRGAAHVQEQNSPLWLLFSWIFQSSISIPSRTDRAWRNRICEVNLERCNGWWVTTSVNSVNTFWILKCLFLSVT